MNGKSAQVYYVNDESWGSAGQGLSFTHIILNRAHLEDKPDFVHDFIFYTSSVISNGDGRYRSSLTSLRHLI